MRTLRSSVLIAGILLSTSLCHARKFVVDSIDAFTNEPVRVVKQKIGDVDYHKFGKVIIEQVGNKYSITLPYFTYTDPPIHKKANSADDIKAKGTLVVFKLSNGKTVKSVTMEDINYDWHYWWHYYAYYNYHWGRGTITSSMPTSLYVYRYKGNIPDYIMANGNYLVPNTGDLYGTVWQIRTGFTSEDMLQLKRHRIVSATIMPKGKKIVLPIKYRQALKIQNSVADLLHK